MAANEPFWVWGAAGSKDFPFDKQGKEGPEPLNLRGGRERCRSMMSSRDGLTDAHRVQTIAE